MKYTIVGKLQYDQSGRAYPENPEIKKNWKKTYKFEDKYYQIVGLPNHAEWCELIPPKPTKIKIKEIQDYHIRRWFNGLETGHTMDEIREDIEIAAYTLKKYKNVFGKIRPKDETNQ